jgi:hypothetical protein
MKSTPGEARLLAGVAKLRGRNASAGERLSEPLRAIAEFVLIVPTLSLNLGGRHTSPKQERGNSRDSGRARQPSLALGVSAISVRPAGIAVSSEMAPITRNGAHS